MFGIFASIRIKDGRQQQFLETIKDTARRSVEQESGCVRFDVWQDSNDSGRYHLYEVYTDEAAFECHLATAHAKQAMEGSSDWAEGPFEVTRATSIHPDGTRPFETAAPAG
jgi:quinol monooxygenase YgiN